MSKFTKGPWAGKHIDIAVHHFEAIGATIAFTGKSEEAMANAALIAAAPELLTALQEIADLPSSRQDECSVLALTAIEKAQGGAE